MDTKDIIKKIAKVHEATTDEISAVIKNSENDGFLFECADKVRREAYGTDVYIRGLIEFTKIIASTAVSGVTTGILSDIGFQ